MFSYKTCTFYSHFYVLLQEFLLAIDVTSSGTPEEKLKWAFRMYDVDGNGVIDIQEMTKIVQVLKSITSFVFFYFDISLYLLCLPRTFQRYFIFYLFNFNIISEYLKFVKSKSCL